jgi:hypothetical protein
MFFWGKKSKDKKDAPSPQGDSKKRAPQGDNKEHAPQGDNKDNTPPDGKKPKRSLRQAFGDAVRDMRSMTRQDLRNAAGETLKDLRKPKEVGILIVAIIVPGGMFGWCAYRLQKFRSRKPANENLPPEGQKPAPPKSPRKPKGGPKQG